LPDETDTVRVPTEQQLENALEKAGIEWDPEFLQDHVEEIGHDEL